jgi:hypothetical protein
MGTNDAFRANWNITLFAVNLTSLFGVMFTLGERHFSVLEMNNIVLLVLKLVHMFTDACHTQIDLAVVAELLSGAITEVTGDYLLCPGTGRGHYSFGDLEMTRKNNRQHCICMLSIIVCE